MSTWRSCSRSCSSAASPGPPPRRHRCARSTSRGPTSELYIRKRPPAPEAPVLSQELKKLLDLDREAARREAHRGDRPAPRLPRRPSRPARPRAEGMFKLAELLWEESRRLYLVRMDEFARALEKCSQQKGECEQPKEPRIELKEAEALYIELHDKHPTFRRMDLVTYLIGFAAKEDNREDEAMAQFQEVIERFPQLAALRRRVDDDRRALLRRRATGPKAQRRLQERRRRRGDERPRDVQDRVVRVEARQHRRRRRRTSSACSTRPSRPSARAPRRSAGAAHRCATRRSSTSSSCSPRIARSRAQGGLRLPRVDRRRAVLARRHDQGRRELRGAGRVGAQQRGVPVPDQDGSRVDQGGRVPARHRRRTGRSALDVDRAQDEIKVLLDNYGPTPRGPRRRRTATRSPARSQTTEELDARHRDEHPRRGAAPREARQEGRRSNLYQRARAGRATSSTSPRSAARRRRPRSAIEIRYYRADILFFKLGKAEEAGDEYLAVGKSAPVGKYHKDALLNAMDAFEKARPKDTAGRTQALPRRQEVRRGDRPLRDAVPRRPDARRRDLQERPDVLRLRRVRRGDQALRRDRHEVPERSERGPRRRPHPVGAQQGAGLREHRGLGAQAEEGAVVRGQGPAGPPRRG